ncbi:MAG: BadF/BadG/BcrA/BcrD ATPase family protein [Thermoprotei archaeon]
MIFIGVDGGGTNTIGVAADERGVVKACMVTDATNHRHVGLDQAVDTLEKLVTELLRDSGEQEASGVFFGLAGIDTDKDYEVVYRALKSVPRIKSFVLRNDTEILYYAATYGEPGIVVIAGTGANVYGKNSLGESWRAGDHGHILGDQGSAYYVAVEALRAAMKAYDGRGPSTMLEDRIRELYGVNHLGELPGVFYALNQSVSEVASIAKYVAEVAEAGDVVAANILKEGAYNLADAVWAVASKLNMVNEKIVVGAGGGMFKNIKQFWQPFAAKVKSILPKATIRKPLYSYEIALGGVVYYLGQRTRVDDALFEKMANQTNRKLETAQKYGK